MEDRAGVTSRVTPGERDGERDAADVEVARIPPCRRPTGSV
jgi:hypothetical protein